MSTITARSPHQLCSDNNEKKTPPNLVIRSLLFPQFILTWSVSSFDLLLLLLLPQLHWPFAVAISSADVARTRGADSLLRLLLGAHFVATVVVAAAAEVANIHCCSAADSAGC